MKSWIFGFVVDGVKIKTLSGLKRDRDGPHHCEKLLAKVGKLKEWLKIPVLKNDFDRVLRLQLASYLPALVPASERESALALLSSKQHADGGWSTRDFSALQDWHFEISETVSKLITSLPDAANPESDAYMTALAIVLLRQSDVRAKDERIQRGITWLKKEQRVSGRWWMHSLYRGNYHYITYIATRSGEPVAAAGGAPERFEADVDVCGAGPFAAGKVRVGFSVRRAGPAAWLDAVSAELLAGSPGLAVVLAPRAKVGGAALTPDAPWVDVASLELKCTRRVFRFPRSYEQALVSIVQVKATGAVSADGRPWSAASPAR